MKEKIKYYLHLYQELTKTYYVRILTCALTYELIMLLIPMLLIINTIILTIGLPGLSEYKLSSFNSGLTMVVFIFNLLWTTSRIMLTFNQTSEMIYHDVERRSFWKSRITSFLSFLLVILFIIVSIILIFVLRYWILMTEKIFIKYLLYVIDFLVKFLSVCFITSFIYKKSIPVPIAFEKTLITSLIITVIWYCLSTVLFPVLKYFLTYSYIQIYSTLASFFIMIYYLYLIVKIFIIGMIYHYYLYQKCIKKDF